MMSQPSYIARDFWRICDRCGFQFRSSQTYRTWDGLYVCREDFETRHPQDFVRGRRDNQAVPHPRPEPLQTFIGPLQTTLTAAALPSATTLQVVSSIRFEPGDSVGIVCADGETIARTIDTVPTPTSLSVTQALQHQAAIGGIVINYSAVSEPDIG